MLSGGSKLLGNSMVAVLGPRLFSSVTTRVVYGEPAATGILTGYKLGIVGVRNRSTLALGEKEQEEKKQATETAGDGNNNEEKRIVSYWGVEAPKVTKEDGTEWRWSCFKVHRLDPSSSVSFSAIFLLNIYELIMFIMWCSHGRLTKLTYQLI